MSDYAIEAAAHEPPRKGELRMSTDYLRGRFEGLNARVDEIHDLQEALRKKNEKIRGYRAALELNTRGRHTAYQLGVEHGKATRPRRPRAHAYIERVGGEGRLWDEYAWEVVIMRGPRWHDGSTFSTHAGALEWALARLKEAGE